MRTHRPISVGLNLWRNPKGYQSKFQYGLMEGHTFCQRDEEQEDADAIP